MKTSLPSDPLLNHLPVKGELSNYKANPAGYAFFTLKDPESRISCVLFQTQARRLGFEPENGMEVLIRGNVSLYEKSGVYQIYVQDMEPAGLGDLHQRFEALKRELKAKGYFDPEKKKALPFFPKRIALVTSETGAAIRDILAVARRRNHCADFYLYPSRVQGAHAAGDLADSIRLANASPNGYDLIILSRGGGSLEELWPFNEEVLSDAIHASAIPVVSAVGHETDFTISDFTADFRAPTPSAAAELCLPDTEELNRRIQRLQEELKARIERELGRRRDRLAGLSPSRTRPLLLSRLEQAKLEVQHLYAHMGMLMDQTLSDRAVKLEGLLESIRRNHPETILQKGYAIVYTESEQIVSDVRQVSENQLLTIAVKNGKINSRVTAIDKEADK